MLVAVKYCVLVTALMWHAPPSHSLSESLRPVRTAELVWLADPWPDRAQGLRVVGADCRPRVQVTTTSADGAACRRRSVVTNGRSSETANWTYTASTSRNW